MEMSSKIKKRSSDCILFAESMVPKNLNNNSRFTHTNYRWSRLRNFPFRRRLVHSYHTSRSSLFRNHHIYFLYPSISGQFISDTIISCILYAFGFVGLFAIYQSTKSAYKPRQAYMMLIIGVAFLLLSYIFLEGAISFKATQGG